MYGNQVVIVYRSGDEWRWRTITPSGRIIASSAAGYPDRENAVISAYAANPDTPVEVDTLFSSVSRK